MPIGNRIVICGSSLVMASVGACLASVPHLEIIRVSEPLVALTDRIVQLDPAVIIFDQVDEFFHFPLGLSQAYPHAAYLSLDLDRGTCTLITGWSSAPVNDANDLSNLILSLVSEKLGAAASSQVDSSAAPEPGCAAAPGQAPVTA